MAQAMIIDSKLRIIFETGVNEKGEAVFKSKTYNMIRKEATANQLQQTASALASLSQHDLAGVERTDNFEIVG